MEKRTSTYKSRISYSDGTGRPYETINSDYISIHGTGDFYVENDAYGDAEPYHLKTSNIYFDGETRSNVLALDGMRIKEINVL